MVSETDEPLDALREAAERSKEARENLVDVLSPTTESLSKISELLDKPDSYVHEMEFSKPPSPSMVTEEEKVDDMDFASVTLEVSPERAEAVVEGIYRRVEEAEKEHGLIERIVLGVPQYKALMAWTQAKHGVDPDGYMPFEEIIVVPGPQIWPVIPNRVTLWEHLE